MAEAEIERLRRENEALRAQQEERDDRLAQAVAAAQDTRVQKNKAFRKPISSKSTGGPAPPTALTITTFPGSPLSIPDDLTRFFGRTFFLPSLTILHPESIHRYQEHLRTSLDPTAKDASYDASIRTMQEVWIPLDNTLSFEAFTVAFQYLIRLVTEIAVADEDKVFATSQLVTFLLDIQARCISHQSWEVYRSYALRVLEEYRVNIERGVSFRQNTLVPFKMEVFNSVAASFGAQGRNCEALFVSRSAPGGAQSPEGALVRTVTEKDKPSTLVKQIVAEQKEISRRVFDGIEARGRVPASVGFSGGSSGANPAPVGPKPQAAGFSRVNRPSPLNAPTGPRASFSSPPPPSASANFTPLGTPQFANVAPSFSPPPPNPGWGRSPAYSPFPQQQYSGGRAASFPPMNSPRSSPYGVPSPSPSPMKKRTANETASIRAKYSGLFLAPQFGGVCIYCRNAGHIHLQCPAPRLSCDPGPPKQVFVEGKPEPVCANANRSLCDYGQSGDGCPRLHVCSLCGSGDHFAPHCPFANGGGGGQS
ncbi:hypothetical protein JCM10213v2_002885 [Rhodosporidiobolus nylandii]